jgi:peptide/nickel transport system substrate-binding protein
MKRGTIGIILTVIMAISLILVSCTSSATTSTTIKTTTQLTIPSTIATSTTSKTTTTVPSTAPTTKTAGHWWDKLGTPQYGSTMSIRINKDITQWDLGYGAGQTGIMYAYTECLIADNWTLDPNIFSYNISWRPSDYVSGLLVKSWEFTDPTTWVIHLRQGIKWQNIPPMNGREFVADDVTFNYNRMLGMGNGFTKPVQSETGVAAWQQLISITSLDKYTAAFKWKTSNVEFIIDTMVSYDGANFMQAPEAIKQWGDLTDWHHGMGTGPFILQDFVSGSSATLVKNTNYWGYDERYPQNSLPYVDTLKVLVIPDPATALAGLRTGKIDAIDAATLTQAQSIQKTNSEILQIPVPNPQSLSVDPRNDKAPFTDLRVRKALQMAIDLPTLATTYYLGTATPYPSALTSVYETGWGWPYQQWPQDLKDEYAYNPTAAKKLLADAGFPSGFKTNVVADVAADLDLLQIVKSYFAAVGIDMTIRTMDSATWQTYVRGRSFDQLDYSSAGTLAFSYDPIRQLQKFATTNGSNYPAVSDPVFDAFYPKAMAASSQDDIKKILRDANEYVARQHFCISLLQPMTYALCQPWLKGFNGQNFAISGFQGPVLIGFYGSRFWIEKH